MTSYLKEKAQWIEQHLDAHLPPADTMPAVLHQAMRYSLFAGGKRIRPILCLASASTLGADEASALLPALALECVHTYSLIHDDLPAMDDDDLRRGQPTCHIAYNEAYAILAGDALLTFAFELLAESKPPPPYAPTQYIRELAEAAGSRGMIAGQVADISAEGTTPSKEQLAFIHNKKTGDLIRAAVRMGAMAAGADETSLLALTTYAEKIGLAFQIVDDILNATSAPEILGKPVGSDKNRSKTTYVALYGIEKSKEQTSILINEAKNALQQIGCEASVLMEIADFVATRAH